MELKRGDVVQVPLPFVQDPTQSKVRPAVIIQNDVGNRHSRNTIVALISSQVPETAYPMHYHVEAGSSIAQAAGLTRDSVVKAEMILTVPQARVISKLGAFPPKAMMDIDRCLKISLALD